MWQAQDYFSLVQRGMRYNSSVNTAHTRLTMSCLFTPDYDFQPLNAKRASVSLITRDSQFFFQSPTFVLFPAAGVVRRVLVFQDNSGTSPSWYLDRILITDLASNDVYNFPCEQWLSKSKSDKRLWKELYATPWFQINTIYHIWKPNLFYRTKKTYLFIYYWTNVSKKTIFVHFQGFSREY